MTRCGAMARSLGMTIEKKRTRKKMNHSVASRRLFAAPQQSKSGLLLHPLLFAPLSDALRLPGLSDGDWLRPLIGPGFPRLAVYFGLVHYVFTVWSCTLSLCFFRKSPLLHFFCCQKCPRWTAPGRSREYCCSKRPENGKIIRVCWELF